MSAKRCYVTTAIPYVNARPHLGHALELVQGDVLARHRRLRGCEVRFLTGTDDNALKNVRAAEQAGADVRSFVDANAERFSSLRDVLELSFDDFIRTSADPRHPPGVDRLWRRCRASGDLYRSRYEGLYCVGCEEFYERDELPAGRCPEHGTAVEQVAEENWFFRLSRYQRWLLDVLESGTFRVEPPQRRAEAIAFVRGGLRDVSVSRSIERARGWGIGVPDDPSQVTYVWFDALGNYVTSLGYGTGADAYRRWWTSSDERLHVVGKGILRFHAVLWPAILHSAGEPPPSVLFVHDYLTERGRKISKSHGEPADPHDVVARYGSDAVRWWLVREVRCVGETDFTEGRVVDAYDRDLAAGIGNLVARTVALRRLVGDHRSSEPGAAASTLPDRIDDALAGFDLRAATGAILDVVAETNRVLEHARPWEAPSADRSRAAVQTAIASCHAIAFELSPFLPAASRRLAEALAGRGPARVFPKSLPQPRCRT